VKYRAGSLLLAVLVGVGAFAPAAPAAPTAPAAASVGNPPGAAAPYSGPITGCALPDPTGTGGCVTGAVAWLLVQVRADLGAFPAACWDRHAWNPRSDHPAGKACDYTIGRLGRYPADPLVTRGWVLAEWLRLNAPALHVHYVIFQGRIWSAERDAEGWRPYGGGGVYDPHDVTGGHWDHLHVSTFD
jgi:hypothetical protein